MRSRDLRRLDEQRGATAAAQRIRKESNYLNCWLIRCLDPRVHLRVAQQILRIPINWLT
jgi:hypothetical protein